MVAHLRIQYRHFHILLSNLPHRDNATPRICLLPLLTIFLRRTQDAHPRARPIIYRDSQPPIS